MLVRDIMVHNVITVSSDMNVFDAEQIMLFHKIGRLPVVDKGKLVGILTRDDILKASPSEKTPLNQRQLFYIFSKLTVKDIMKTDVFTITPDITVEKAVRIAQKNKTGSLPVVENDKVVGIITTNDVFYNVVNPMFGFDEKGARIIVYNAGYATDIEKILNCSNKHNLTLNIIWAPKRDDKHDLILHFNEAEVDRFIAELKQMGYKVDSRDFNV